MLCGRVDNGAKIDLAHSFKKKNALNENILFYFLTPRR